MANLALLLGELLGLLRRLVRHGVLAALLLLALPGLGGVGGALVELLLRVGGGLGLRHGRVGGVAQRLALFAHARQAQRDGRALAHLAPRRRIGGDGDDLHRVARGELRHGERELPLELLADGVAERAHERRAHITASVGDGHAQRGAGEAVGAIGDECGGGAERGEAMVQRLVGGADFGFSDACGFGDRAGVLADGVADGLRLAGEVAADAHQLFALTLHADDHLVGAGLGLVGHVVDGFGLARDLAFDVLQALQGLQQRLIKLVDLAAHGFCELARGGFSAALWVHEPIGSVSKAACFRACARAVAGGEA